MVAVQKFNFDLSFDRDRSDFDLGATIEAAPPPPTFSQDELETARRLAFDAGRAAAESEVRARAERQTSDAVDLLTQAIERLAEAGDLAVEAAERQAATVLLTALRKLFPALVERSGLLEIEALLQDVFSQSVEHARLVVRCSVQLQDRVEPLVRAAAARAAFDGRIAIIVDPRLKADDFKMEWPEGGIERAPGRIIDKIERAIIAGMEAYDRRVAEQTGAGRNL